jgi:hypothetical protein
VEIYGYIKNIGKIVPGVWKFFSYDSFSVNLTFLLSHNEDINKIIFLPSLLISFSLLNFNKLFSFYFKKNRPYFKGLYRIIFIKQKGFCYCCKQLLNLDSIKLVDNKYCYFRRKFLYPIIVHNYCFI